MPEVAREILEEEIRRLEKEARGTKRRIEMLEEYVRIIPMLTCVLCDTMEKYLRPIGVTEMSILD